MGRQRRRFDSGLRQQIVQEVESGLLSVSAASRKYQISGSVIDPWRRQVRQGGLQAGPSAREKFLEQENRKFKEKMAELAFGERFPKKRGVWLRQQISVNTSVIAAESLAGRVFRLCLSAPGQAASP